MIALVCEKDQSAGTSATMAEDLSAYELERLANIKRNDQKLIELGLVKPLTSQRKVVTMQIDLLRWGAPYRQFLSPAISSLI